MLPDVASSATEAIIRASDWSALLRSVKLEAPGANPWLENIAGSLADMHPVSTNAKLVSITAWPPV